MKACFAKSPPTARAVALRADKGFYDHKIIEWAEAHEARFVIVARLTRPIKHRLTFLRYTDHGGNLSTAQFLAQPHGWARAYRFVVVRRPIPEEPTEQLSLFPLGRYVYQVLVTNLASQALKVWRFYNARAKVEQIIKELKGDYPLSKIPTRSFRVNETYFHLLLLAYNLVNWFKRLCLPPALEPMTLATLRTRFFLAPAQLIRTDNRPTLKLPRNFLYQDAWNYAFKQIDQFHL